MRPMSSAKAWIDRAVAAVDADRVAEELAALVGASRERVNKALAMFSRLGWIEPTGRSRYRIVARDQLARRAGA